MKSKFEILDLINGTIDARVPGANPDPSYPFPFFKDDTYNVPDIFAVYTHTPVTVDAFSPSTANEILTQQYPFVLENMVSNISLVESVRGNLTASQQIGQAGNTTDNLQLQAADSQTWLPIFANSHRIDCLYQLGPQRRAQFSYNNKTNAPIGPLQTAWIGWHNRPGIHEPYDKSGLPFMYVTPPVNLAAGVGKTATVSFIIDGYRDFYMRALVGTFTENNVAVQIKNYGTQYNWVNVDASLTPIGGVMLDNIAYNFSNFGNNFPTGFSPFVIRHTSKITVQFINVGGAEEVGLQLNFFGNNCFYERSPVADAYLSNK